ncbi:MAG: tRNA (adenosine(37)-N6)-dimethylallyltransferase MiaA [Lentisphaeria bacterium]
MKNQTTNTIPTLIITGPTATGKTALAVCLAQQFNGEIISADSRQVYRGLDLGTGKDLEEYQQKNNSIPYHLIDIVDPMEEFNLFLFVQKARQALLEIKQRNTLPILCGGTPLYINALLKGYDLQGGEPDEKLRKELALVPLPELIKILKKEAPKNFFDRVDCTQPQRVIRAIEIVRTKQPPQKMEPLQNTLVIAPKFSRPILHQRIEKRLRDRFNNGMLQEAKTLHDHGMTWEKMEWLGLEYRYMARHLSGQLSFDDMFQQLLAHIRQFCKRQDIWFRKMERENIDIHWIPEGNYNDAVSLVQNWLTNNKKEPNRKILE